MNNQKSPLIQELEKKLLSLRWPSGHPSMTSPLGELVTELMTNNPFIVGCITQVIDKGTLDQRLWPILAIDEALTERIAATNEPLTEAYLAYKRQLDECLRLAQAILQQPDP